VNTVDEYDASAHDTIDRGIHFEYVDDGSLQPRVGYYDRWTERLTVLGDDQQLIVSHFRSNERYVSSRRSSSYA
jgi:hypothetical protein